MKPKRYRSIGCGDFKVVAKFEHKKMNKHRSRKCFDCAPKPKSLLKGQVKIDADNEAALFIILNKAW